MKARSRGSFVGRRRELQALARLLDEGARLVTLTGAAGMGKTRLALEWAGAAGEAPPRDGVSVLFCALSEARSVDDACEVLAGALGVPLAAGATAGEIVAQLGRALADEGPVVLVLDNLEQLAPVATQMIEPWLALALQAQLLVTSRERLRLPDERCLELDPLAVPAEDARSREAIAASEAVLLFVERTRAVRFDFELTEADAESVAAIVRRLEGIPLAVELCAARMGVLGPKQILARLGRRFDLLVTGARDAPARQATLHGAIAWSWDLLDPGEKTALAQCSVFRGGFSLEAAEAVIALGDGPATRPLDALQSLHEKSLVRAFEPGDSPGERRYGLLESIREFAEERLVEQGGTTAAEQRHAAFFLEMAAPRADLRRVTEEADNLAAACERALARRPFTALDADVALRGLLALEPVLLVCAKGRLEPYTAMLDAALLATPSPLDPVIHARALATRALADLLRGRILECFAGFLRALSGAREAGSRLDEGLALGKIGLLLEHADQPDEARECFEQARAIAADLGDPRLDGDYLLMRGGGLTWRGRAADAAWHQERAVEKFRLGGYLQGESMALAQLALARLNLGRLDESEADAEQALTKIQSAGERRTEGYVLGVLGRVQHAKGRFDEARATYGAALAIHRAVGDRWSEAIHRGFLGDVALEESRFEDAALAYSEAIELLRDLGERHYTAIFLAALGVAELALDRAGAADADFQAARAALEGVRVLVTRAAVDLHRAHEGAARARRAEDAGDAAAAADHRRAATAAIALAEAPAPDGSAAPVLCSEHVRFAVRLLARDLGARPPEGAPVDPRCATPTLIVGPDARWFRDGDHEPVSMLKARSARLMLGALVRARIDAPGRATSLDALFAAGWPGERIPRKAAANRVYVNLTKLKKLGLRGLLQSRDDGFLLDPGAVVLEALDHDSTR